MWYEILPSFGIIFAAMAAPHGIAYVLNFAVNGNMFRRNLVTKEEMLTYLRDRRLTGDSYKVQGLEAIPDD